MKSIIEGSGRCAENKPANRRKFAANSIACGRKPLTRLQLGQKKAGFVKETGFWI